MKHTLTVVAIVVIVALIVIAVAIYSHHRSKAIAASMKRHPAGRHRNPRRAGNPRPTMFVR